MSSEVGPALRSLALSAATICAFVGRVAILASSALTYAESDLPSAAARSFSVSATFSGTSRMYRAVSYTHLDVYKRQTRETFDDGECERLLRGYLSKALFDAGLYCRADDRGDPVVQLAPPLTIGQPEFDDIASRLRSVLKDAEQHL